MMLGLLFGEPNAAIGGLQPDPPPAAARVVVVRDPNATQSFRANPEPIRAMVDKGVMGVTRKDGVPAAWLSLVTIQDVVGIKVHSLPGPYSGTRPAVVAALVEGLLAAGLPPTNIVVWDKQSVDLRLAGFYELATRYGIRVASASQAGYDPTNSYENPLIGNLIWGDVEFGQKGVSVGRRSFVSRLVSQDLTKIINCTPLLNHNYAGVSGNLYSLAMGSVDNSLRFEADTTRLSTAIPEIYALPSLSDKVVLNVVDALICQYEGGERGLLHYTATLNELRFSRDPVALDVLSVRELTRLRQASNSSNLKTSMDLYENASLMELGVSDPQAIQTEIVP